MCSSIPLLYLISRRAECVMRYETLVLAKYVSYRRSNMDVLLICHAILLHLGVVSLVYITNHREVDLRTH
jgi:hypothetical protein